MKTSTIQEPGISGWVEITADDQEAVKTQKAKATPSPRIFTLRDDGDNADGHFAKLDRKAVISGAKDSISFLKTIGFAKR